jgi:hypothetical protein
VQRSHRCRTWRSHEPRHASAEERFRSLYAEHVHRPTPRRPTRRDRGTRRLPLHRPGHRHAHRPARPLACPPPPTPASRTAFTGRDT